MLVILVWILPLVVDSVSGEAGDADTANATADVDGAHSDPKWPVVELVITFIGITAFFVLLHVVYSRLRTSSDPRGRRMFEVLHKIIEENRAEPLPDIAVHDKYGESSVPGIYLAGEIVGTFLKNHGINEGREAIRRIASKCTSQREEGTEQIDGGIFDVIILGASPAGIAAAEEAEVMGLGCLMLQVDPEEKDSERVTSISRDTDFVVVTTRSRHRSRFILVTTGNMVQNGAGDGMRETLVNVGLKYEGDESLGELLERSWSKRVIRNDILGGIILTCIGIFIYYFLKHNSFTGDGAYYIAGYSLSFWYYTLYTTGVIAFGLWFMYRFRDARNKKALYLRMSVIMVVQATIGYMFSNPDHDPFMRRLTGNDFFNWEIYQLIIVWPLELQPVVWNWLRVEWVNHGFYLPWVLFLSFFGIPVGAFLFGKGFFCSGLCGCGALAETVGDPFRAKAMRNTYAYKLEYAKYVILLIAIGLTLFMIRNRIIVEDPSSPFYHVSYFIYWMVILWFLSSVIGVTTYPVLSGRSWCRFFCPMAAYLSLFSMISPNSIRTSKERCIGCNLCNDNCQYGINIRGKAQRGMPVRTRECTQCGVCVAVCPTEALKVQYTLGKKCHFEHKHTSSVVRSYRWFGKRR